MIFVGSGEVLAFIEDGPHGGETLFINAGSDGLPPQEIELSSPGILLRPFEESSLRHSTSVPTATYRLVQQGPRERGGFVYKLVRS